MKDRKAQNENGKFFWTKEIKNNMVFYSLNCRDSSGKLFGVDFAFSATHSLTAARRQLIARDLQCHKKKLRKAFAG